MRVSDILEHFLSRATWVDRAQTVDRVIVGDSEREVDQCFVAWMPSLSALRETARRGRRLLICHEPVFWNHRDDLGGNPRGLVEKLRYIEDHGLTILRLHDTWDRWPELGVPHAWAGFLGLSGRAAAVGGDGYQLCYPITRVSFERFAKSVASRTATLGQKQIAISGDPKKGVSRVGVGTGCATSLDAFLQMGCDCVILCDDGVNYWGDVQQAKDLNLPAIIVNHGVAEEPGMATLTDYINSELSGVAARHLPQGCRFRLIEGW
jgi:putative NIF3 family GTP cyclohydrolase 1 type 2